MNMMKKEYKKPDIVVVKVKTEGDMMMSSLGGDHTNDNLSRENNIDDTDWDDEY